MVKRMLQARAVGGAPVTSLVIQPGVKARRPRPLPEDLLADIKTYISDTLRECVEELVVALPDEHVPLEHPIRDIWRIEDEEKYWTFGNAHQ